MTHLKTDICVIGGGAGNDHLGGGFGDDLFLFSRGDGFDKIVGFDRFGDDRIGLSVEGVESFDDLASLARDVRGGVTFLFGEGDALLVRGVDLDDLAADDFLFA